MIKEPKIVCLGGGVGTVQLLRGLRQFTHQITVVVSMADDGGSAGRLRRLYSIPPPGDLINCLAALSNAEPMLNELLTFRFKGGRWGRDDSLGGQKLGNLILVALTQITGDFSLALREIQRIFRCHGVILPATNENVSIWAKTIEGRIVKGEVNIDLGRYSGKREISEIHLEPEKNSTPQAVITAMDEADLVIAGPGDLYTTILPLLLVKDIHKQILKIPDKTLFVVNIANKPFETPNYKACDYLKSVVKHLSTYPFRYTLINNYYKYQLPAKLSYNYVPFDHPTLKRYNTQIVTANLVNPDFPLYHSPQKLASLIRKLL